MGAPQIGIRSPASFTNPLASRCKSGSRLPDGIWKRGNLRFPGPVRQPGPTFRTEVDFFNGLLARSSRFWLEKTDKRSVLRFLTVIGHEGSQPVDQVGNSPANTDQHDEENDVPIRAAERFVLRPVEPLVVVGRHQDPV